MSALHALSRYVLTLPGWIRVGSVCSMVALFILLYIFYLPVVNNPSIFIIPVALAAWMFKRRGVFFSVASIASALFLILSIQYNLKHHTYLMPLSTNLSFVVGTIALLIVGFLISAQRTSIEIAEHAQQQLEETNRQQLRLNKLKDQFILSVNHELRTPLTAVSGYLELLLQHDTQMDGKKRTQFLKNALYSCEELQLLVNNVLDTMQMSNEKPVFAVEALPIAAIIHEEIVHIDPRQQQDHLLRLDIPEHFQVEANAQYVRQILRNLLSNAFKYAPANTPIEVKAHQWGLNDQYDPTGPMICVSVRDRGPGIPPDDLPRLFNQFFRLERDINGKVRGTGLGLYVSKQLVEAMGGKIWVESSGIAGEGSRFRFTLPCASFLSTRQRGYVAGIETDPLTSHEDGTGPQEALQLYQQSRSSLQSSSFSPGEST